MKTRTILFALSTVLLVGETGSTAQQLGRRSNSFTLHPCPGGTGSKDSDIGMVQRRQELRLAFESGHALGVPSEDLREHLQRDVAVQTGVAGTVDLAHAAAPASFSTTR